MGSLEGFISDSLKLEKGLAEVLAKNAEVRSVVDELAGNYGIDVSEGFRHGLLKVEVTGIVSQADRSMLEEAFGHFMNLKFVDSGYVITHSLMNKMRSLMKIRQLDFLDNSFGFQFEEEKPRFLIAGEANFIVKQFVNRINVVASAAPIFSGRDYNRFVGPGKGETRFGEHDTSMRLQDISIRADYGMMTDVYDIPVKDLAACMVRNGLKVFSYALIDPMGWQVYIDDADGVRRSIHSGSEACYWFSTVSGKRRINMAMGGRSMTYSHDLETYKQLTTAGTQVVNNGGAYVVELAERNAFYSHYLLVPTEIQEPLVYQSVHVACGETDVEIFEYSGKGDLADRNSYTSRFVSFDENSWQRLVTALLSSNGVEYLQDIEKFFNAVVSTAHIVGTKVSTRLTLAEEDGVKLSAGLLAMHIQAKTEDYRKFAVSYENAVRVANEDGGILGGFSALVSAISLSAKTISMIMQTSPTLQGWFDTLSGRSMLKNLGLMKCGDFRPIVKSGKRGRTIVPDLVRDKETIKQTGLMFILSEEERRIVADWAVTETDMSVTVVEKEEISENLPEKDFAVPDLITEKAVIDELEQKLSSDIFDIESAVIATMKDMGKKNYIENSWVPQSGKQECITVITVADGKIVEKEGYHDSAMVLISMDMNPNDLDLNNHPVGTYNLIVGGDIQLQDGKYFMTKELEIFLDSMVKRNIGSLRMSSSPRYVEVKAGVPGAGKTFDIVNDLWDEACVIVTKTKPSQSELIKELTKKYGENFDPTRVVTAASLMVNKKLRTHKIIIEEASLCFYGEVLAIIAILAPSDLYPEVELYLVGDEKQMKASARRSFDPKLQSYPKNVWVQEVGNFDALTIRNTAKTVELYKRLYSELGTVKTTNTYPGGVSYMKVNSADEIPLMQGVWYITYTQQQVSEFNLKYAVSTGSKKVGKLEKKVFTPEESQGQTKPFVMILRPDPKVKTPYLNESMFLVAVSRMTHHVMLVDVGENEDWMSREFRRVSMMIEPTQNVDLSGKKPNIHSSGCQCINNQRLVDFFKNVERENSGGRFSDLNF